MTGLPASTLPIGSPTDPILFRMQRDELERRWSLARKRMVALGLDAVIAVGFDDSLSGYVRWFCDFGAPAYMKVAVFFTAGPMTTVDHGAVEGYRDVSPEDPNNPGVGRIIAASAFKSVMHTSESEARSVAAELHRRGAKSVGLLRWSAMPAGFVDRLKAELPDVTWSDPTDAFDAIKAVKSEAELDSLREACRIQDEVFAVVLDHIRPGVREADLLSIAERELRLRGAIDGTLASGSAPPGASAGIRPWRAQNRVLEKGDMFTILLELSNGAGYYGEMARQVVLGKVNEEQQAAFDIVFDAQQATVANFRPGASCRELAAAHDRFMESRGEEGETRLFSHSQGYDMVERPLVRHDESMSLEAGMFLSCHPAIAKPSLFVFLCDNFIVHADRPAERVHKTAQQIFEV